MSASNADVVETLGLDIKVNYTGEKKLLKFNQTITSLATVLENANVQLREFLQMSNSMNGMKVSVKGVSKALGVTNSATPTTAMDSDTATSPSTNIPQTTKDLKEYKESVDKASKSTNKFSGAVLGLVKSLGRIALYRAMRTIMKNIAEGFTTGVQNLARYSSEFNNTMSDFVNSTAYLKNSLGTLAQPVLELLLPALEEVIDALVSGINKMNELIALVNGEATYTAAVLAKKGSANWKDYAESLDESTSSAKALQKQLMGFDEINKLNDNSSSSSSSGSDYSTMFEEKSVSGSNDFTTSLALTIKDVFFDWDDVSDEALAEKICVGLTTLSGGIIGFAIGGVGGAKIGALIGLGLGLFIDSIVFDHDGSLSSDELATVLSTGLSALLVAGLAVLVKKGLAAGAAKGFSTATTLTMGTTAGGVAAAIGIGLTVGLALSMVISAIALDGFTVSEFTDYITNIGKQVKAGFFKGFNESQEDGDSKFVSFFKGLWEAVKAFYGIESPSKLFAEIGRYVIEGFWNGIVEKWESVKTWWNETKTKITTSMTNIKTSIVGVFDTVKNKFTSFKDTMTTGIKNLVNNIISGVEWAINKVLYGLNWLLVKAKNIINSLPESVRNALNLDKILSKQVDYVSLPRFANGGFPEDGVFMANHSELVGQFSNGKTAVANNQQITDGIAQATYQAFKQAISESTSSSGSQDIYIDGEKVFSVIKKRNDTYTKMYGMSPLTSY